MPSSRCMIRLRVCPKLSIHRLTVPCCSASSMAMEPSRRARITVAAVDRTLDDSAGHFASRNAGVTCARNAAQRRDAGDLHRLGLVRGDDRLELRLVPGRVDQREQRDRVDPRVGRRAAVGRDARGLAGCGRGRSAWFDTAHAEQRHRGATHACLVTGRQRQQRPLAVGQLAAVAGAAQAAGHALQQRSPPPVARGRLRIGHGADRPRQFVRFLPGREDAAEAIEELRAPADSCAASADPGCSARSKYASARSDDALSAATWTHSSSIPASSNRSCAACDAGVSIEPSVASN